MSTRTDDLWQRFRAAPRAMHWLAAALVVVVLVLLWDSSNKLATSWSNEADRIESRLRTIREAEDLAAQLARERTRQTIASVGHVEMPQGSAETAQQLNQVVNGLMREFSVSDDSFTTRAEGKLQRGILASLTNDQRLDMIRGDLSFESSPEDAVAIVARLESSPAIERLTSLRFDRSGSGRIKVRVTLEAWVGNLGSRT